MVYDVWDTLSGPVNSWDRFYDPAWSWIADHSRDFYRWLEVHEQSINLSTVWMLAVGFFVLFAVKFMTYFVIRNQRPQTVVGMVLRKQKAAESFMFLFLSGIFTAQLTLYYSAPDVPIDVIARSVLRLLVNFGLIGGVFYGLRLCQALLMERFGAPIRADELYRYKGRKISVHSKSSVQKPHREGM